MRLVIAIIFCLLANISWSADFQKGMSAFENGDYETAYNNWKPLAELGNQAAQTGIGFLYFDGVYVRQDYKKARKWFLLAARQGEYFAQQALGYIYNNGLDTPVDTSKALAWYLRSADQGYYLAQTNVGVMYQAGEGIQVNHRKSLKYFGLAAEQGFAPAQYLLGMIYMLSYQDYVSARMWGRVALLNGLELQPDMKRFPFNLVDFVALGEKLIKITGERLTDAEIEQAEQLALECIQKQYNNCVSS